jgi:hypothetical protein
VEPKDSSSCSKKDTSPTDIYIACIFTVKAFVRILLLIALDLRVSTGHKNTIIIIIIIIIVILMYIF